MGVLVYIKCKKIFAMMVENMGLEPTTFRLRT